MLLPKDGKFAFVLWDDAHSPAATAVYDKESVSTIHGSMPILTGGWILRDDAKGVTLAGEYCGDEEFRGVTFVPRSLVVEMRLLPPLRQSSKTRRAKAPAAHTETASPSAEPTTPQE